MNLKLFILALCLLAFGATYSQSTAKQVKTVIVNGITYTTANPPTTLESLTKGATKTGETIEIDNVVCDVYQSKPTKKYPEGRIFLVHKNSKGNLSRLYLRQE